MIAVTAVVASYAQVARRRADNDVLVTVTINIARCKETPGGKRCRPTCQIARHGPFAGIHPAVSDIAPYTQAFIRDHDAIEQSIIVVVEELCCARGFRTGRRCDRLEPFPPVADSKQTRSVRSAK